jgi:hypothetical protein
VAFIFYIFGKIFNRTSDDFQLFQKIFNRTSDDFFPSKKIFNRTSENFYPFQKNLNRTSDDIFTSKKILNWTSEIFFPFQKKFNQTSDGFFSSGKILNRTKRNFFQPDNGGVINYEFVKMGIISKIRNNRALQGHYMGTINVGAGVNPAPSPAQFAGVIPAQFIWFTSPQFIMIRRILMKLGYFGNEMNKIIVSLFFNSKQDEYEF